MPKVRQFGVTRLHEYAPDQLATTLTTLAAAGWTIFQVLSVPSVVAGGSKQNWTVDIVHYKE